MIERKCSQQQDNKQTKNQDKTKNKINYCQLFAAEYLLLPNNAMGFAFGKD